MHRLKNKYKYYVYTNDIGTPSKDTYPYQKGLKTIHRLNTVTNRWRYYSWLGKGYKIEHDINPENMTPITVEEIKAMYVDLEKWKRLLYLWHIEN